MQPRARFQAGLEITEAAGPVKLPPAPYGLSPTQQPSLEAMTQWQQECARLTAGASKPVQILSKSLVVTGEREWRKRSLLTRLVSGFTLPAWKLTSPAPTCEVPLRYEYAFGGENKILVTDRNAKRVPSKSRIPDRKPQPLSSVPADADIPAIAHAAYQENPVGSGYAEKWFLKAARLKAVRAPQIESTTERIGRFNKAYTPQGFGIVGRAWQSRLPFAGTYDEHWRTERHPNLPADFDFQYWNSAPADQQITPYLDGHETFALTNLCTPATPGARVREDGNTELAFALPGHLPFVLVRYEDGPLGELSARLDTVMIDTTPAEDGAPRNATVVCVWRATVGVEPEIRVLEARMIAKQDVDEMRAKAQRSASGDSSSDTHSQQTTTA